MSNFIIKLEYYKQVILDTDLIVQNLEGLNWTFTRWNLIGIYTNEKNTHLLHAKPIQFYRVDVASFSASYRRVIS